MLPQAVSASIHSIRWNHHTEFLITNSVEDTSNTSIQWDNKTQNIYIHGQPRAAKKAHTIITTQMSKLASPKVIMTPRIPKPAGPKFIATPQTMVNLNLLGKDFTDGVHFCKLTDETTSSDDGNGSQGDRDSTNSGAKRKPASFVVHPITMTEEEKQRGRIMARDLWRNADFVGWDFKENVIRDASMVLRRQIMELPQGQGKYLKLEVLSTPSFIPGFALMAPHRLVSGKSSFMRITIRTIRSKTQSLRSANSAISALIMKSPLFSAGSGTSLGSHI